MPNELKVGTRRVGDFIDFYPDTPEVKVTLERSERGINVTLPWSDPESPYAQWFTAGRGREQNSAGPEPLPAPRRVLFYDSHGSVLLIRCWPRGFHSNMLGPGTGRLWAHAAIMGVRENLEFERPHGMQTEISGLRAWLGITSWQETASWGTGAYSASLTSQSVSTIEVGEINGMTLSFQPNWQLVPEEDHDRRVVLDLLRVVTRSAEPLDWDRHLDVHRAIRDLLVLSRWHEESCVVVFALRSDDPIRTIDNKEHGEQWRAVIVAKEDRASSLSRHRQHLVQYDELQVHGIARWLRIRDEFARALDPVVSSIELRGTTANTLLAHTGPGLEALGYLLMLRDCASEKSAARANLRSRFDRILKDVGDVLPFEGSTWANETVAAYNGLKHANRAEPAAVDVLNLWRESVMVVRAWVALELGVPFNEVKERLAADPQGNGYIKVE
ncbi:reverse gyrase [Glutamicibacter protophormiae]|uniref:ApeA N-terminal domain 1-containing protein n=1 Tax=Glutamicibacter protophormiae TaxID=37930 RepID=UPI003A8DE6B6